ncbi:MAG TPA: hypothetical protein VLH61_10185 [Bacteroidales bacterium]|nr:hypothetical protein [Bacteroidales bacterium]
MRPRKKKAEYSFAYVLLGLALGFFIGASLVYWFSNRHNESFFANDLWANFQNAVFGNGQEESVSSSDDENRVIGSKDNLPLNNNQRITRLVLPDLPSESAEDRLASQNLDFHNDTLLYDTGGTEFFDQQNNFQKNDSTASNQGVLSENQMQFAQDRLLQIRAYNIGEQVRDNVQSEAQRQLDSLLGNYAKDIGSRQVLIVEFWQSPLRIMGYKMTRSKLILYGLEHLESFSLHSDGDSFLVKYADNYYAVSLTNVFTPLRSIEYPEVLEEFYQRWP